MLNDSLNWKLKTSVEGKASISLRFDFSELKVTTVLDSGAMFTKIISSDEIVASNRWMYEGYNDAIVSWLINTSSINLSGAVVGTTGKVDTATTYLYYR